MQASLQAPMAGAACEEDPATRGIACRVWSGASDVGKHLPTSTQENDAGLPSMFVKLTLLRPHMRASLR